MKEVTLLILHSQKAAELGFKSESKAGLLTTNGIAAGHFAASPHPRPLGVPTATDRFASSFPERIHKPPPSILENRWGQGVGVGMGVNTAATGCPHTLETRGDGGGTRGHSVRGAQLPLVINTAVPASRKPPSAQWRNG